MNQYITIGNQDFFRQNKTYIMAIYNVTPDSFSDGGKHTDVTKVAEHVSQMIADGADIIDVGGESTRPGYMPVSEEEEIARIVPVIQAIKKHFKVPVSVDTYKSTVAEAAILAGADMVNDIWGLKYDDNMASVIAKYNVACCLMHNRKDIFKGEDIVSECIVQLQESLEIAKDAGISEDKIILDPGIGFGKTHEQNLCVMQHLEEFCSLGCPILLGTSRKSMVGNVLNLPVEERLEGTLSTSVFGVVKGVSWIRVHDVKENHRAVKMTEAMLNVHTGVCEWHRVYLGVGSNIGDKQGYINQALDMLCGEDIRRVKCSHLLKTKPYGGVKQDDFLNACIYLETKKSPRQLLKFINEIEATLGRERLIRWGPRTIDLDILLYDDQIVDETDLKIPHIDMHNREFVLKTLAEIGGHVVHPVLHKTIHELYSDISKGEY